jgi:hypothetical protein
MATAEDLRVALDKFMEARKTIRGAETGYAWSAGHNQYERQTSFPIEVGGELAEPARLLLVGFPQSRELKFRISLCFNAAICRLDYTDETHPNSQRAPTDNIPPSVTGPHYHSWRSNRRFFKGASKAPELHNAEPFTMDSSFDSILRWFCHDTNIDQLSGGHLIQLPPRDRLI